MKNALLIALALTSVTAFAGTKATKAERKAAVEACKAEGKVKKELKLCVKEKLTAPAAQAAAALPANRRPPSDEERRRGPRARRRARQEAAVSADVPARRCVRGAQPASRDADLRVLNSRY